MNTVKQLFDAYKQQAQQLLNEENTDRNARLVALENQIADASALPEGDRLELRAYMQEYRRQKINDYEAGATNPHISNKDSGPRSGEYDT
ncbi:MAG TPA: hypothetical protein PL009_08545 [Flavipsychrobacter sp.]|nr:hypothetical protein [Flavipsychrobacter sp.]